MTKKTQAKCGDYVNSGANSLVEWMESLEDVGSFDWLRDTLFKAQEVVSKPMKVKPEDILKKEDLQRIIDNMKDSNGTLNKLDKVLKIIEEDD